MADPEVVARHEREHQQHYSGAGTAAAPVPTVDLSSDNLQKVLRFLQRHGFKDAEQALQREASERATAPKPQDGFGSQNELDGTRTDPLAYETEYKTLLSFVDASFDNLRPELGLLLYPVFAHMYLELVISDYGNFAADFLRKFSSAQESFWLEDIKNLRQVTTKEQLLGNSLLEPFSSNHYVIRMSRACINHVKPFLVQSDLLQKVVRQHMVIEPTEAAPRSKASVYSTAGSLLGEAWKTANKSRVYYGVSKEDSNLADDDAGGARDQKKRRMKGKDGVGWKEVKSRRADPNTPSAGRIPLPDWSDAMRDERAKSREEVTRRAKLSANALPSICFYTLLNSREETTCCSVSEDSSLLVSGFDSSLVQVWSLNQEKIKPLKSAEQLDQLDLDSEDIQEVMLDESSASTSVILRGHDGPVYGVSVSPDKNLVLSCSEDSTVRLWSLQTMTNLVVYKTGGYPVWDVTFGNRGYYFASAGADRTAMLWSTDRQQPLRIFAGHYTDINCVTFHPNSNYLVSGSDDRAVRLWDLTNGHCVRVFTGHKAGVSCVACSLDGRYVVSGAVDGVICVWEISGARLLATHEPHTISKPLGVSSLAFSRDGGMLAAGGLDNRVRLYDFQGTVSTSATEDSESIPEPKINPTGFNLASISTKSTPVLNVHFTRRNLLLGFGAFVQ